MASKSQADDRGEIEKIRQIAIDFFSEIWNQGDESAIDKFISVNTVGNDPQFGTGRSEERRVGKV